MFKDRAFKKLVADILILSKTDLKTVIIKTCRASQWNELVQPSTINENSEDTRR